MADLVLLRESIRTPGTCCASLNIDRVYTQLGLKPPLGCIITRSSPPCNPVAIVLTPSLIGAKLINARTRAGKSRESFAKRYAKRLTILLQLGVCLEELSRPCGGLGGTCVLARQASAAISIPDRDLALKTTRSLPLIQRDVLPRGYPMPIGPIVSVSLSLLLSREFSRKSVERFTGGTPSHRNPPQPIGYG